MTVIRREKLLEGLYVFPMADEAKAADQIYRAAAKVLPGCLLAYDRFIGHARHVFTHIIWEMDVHCLEAAETVEIDGCIWADEACLKNLPMPTAVKFARTAAEQMLGERNAKGVKR